MTKPGVLGRVLRFPSQGLFNANRVKYFDITIGFALLDFPNADMGNVIGSRDLVLTGKTICTPNLFVKKNMGKWFDKTQT